MGQKTLEGCEHDMFRKALSLVKQGLAFPL